KKSGGKSNWGAGLDYLLKNYWDDLDKLIEDNYYKRHNKKLISYLFSRMPGIIEESIKKMRNLCKRESDKKGLNDWIKKVNAVLKYRESAKNLNEKVIFIDNLTQFLRETTIGSRRDYSNISVLKKKSVGRRGKLEFRGQSVNHCVRKIKGIAKIIINRASFKKLKTGDILVTDETDASFLPLMKKARAIITDTGGILCHAAIAARELEKPCIVGATIATKILKDGDLVEVDADKGIVKILKKAK
ncbi:MAG: pyruvate, water dikinase, partial [Parcubacteria group bacterium Athens1014_10]